MIKRICNWWIKFRTKNYTLIPLFTVTFDYNKFMAEGKAGSCTVHIHPDIAEDDFLEERLQQCIDYIRDNYDMDNFTKI